MDFPITITRKKIKNLYLRVRPDGSVTVSAPRRCSDKVIRDFINSKSDWIAAQLQRIEERKSAELQAEQKQTAEPFYTSGEIHYFWGCPCQLLVEETTGRSSVTFVKNPQFGRENGTEGGSGTDILHMRAPQNSTVEQRKYLLTEFYREQLKLAVPELMEHYSGIVGRSPAEWRIRNMKTRWGTCNTQNGRIWLSLYLAKKPPDCLEYVIAHELTHLHVPNHSKAFWARMDVYYPRWREVRKLLREQG